MEYPAGEYVATLKLNEGRLFDDIRHHIEIHSNGMITESHYTFDHGNGISGTKEFIPSRIWDRTTINKYELV